MPRDEPRKGEPQTSAKEPIVSPYTALLDLAKAISRYTDLPRLFRDLPERLRRIVKFDLLYILLHDSAGQTFRMHLLEGGSTEITLHNHEFAADESLAGWGLHTLEPFVIGDLEYEAVNLTLRNFLLERQVKSVCTLSLDTAHGRIGAMAVASAEAHAYAQKEIESLQLVATQVAAAINSMLIGEELAAIQERLVREGSRFGKRKQWWQSVFENSIIGVVLSDPKDGGILAANPVYQRLVGYTEKELRAMTFLDITPEEDREWNWALNIELREGKRNHYQIEKRYRRKDGRLIWVKFSVSLVPGTQNLPRLQLGLCEDITERKLAEEALCKSEERSRTLLEINNAIITNLDQQTLFHSICEALRRAIPCDKAGLALYEPQADDLRVLALDGNYSGQTIDVGQLIDRKGVESGNEWDFREVLMRSDMETERQYTFEHKLYEEGVRSHITLPLVIHGEAVGCVGVGSLKTEQYREADLQFMQEVTKQMALAVANMKAYEEIRALSEREAAMADRRRTLLEINNAIITSLTEDALLQAVTEALGRVVPFDGAAITLYQPATQTLRFLATESGLLSDYFKKGLEYKHKESISGWVTEHQQVVVRHDLENEQRYGNDRRLLDMGIKSDCIIPLIVRGNAIGTLNVASRKKDHFSEAHLEFLQEVGNQIALAVANMQSYEEITTLKVRLEKENIYLKEEIRTEHNFEEIIGNSPPLLELLRRVDQVAPTDSSVLIYGETGTGKELIARALHNRSPRKNRPLVKVNCSAISAGLVESELFGHMKGAFTGAFERRIGRFELADRGTIFLDEIGELPLETQVKLLRVLQEREFEPVGSNRSVHVDVRIIAATNRNLLEAIRGGRFRSDLFYRLNVFPLEMPALRDRPSDISQLAIFFLSRHSRNIGKKVDGISQAARDRLESYRWPGNVRELQNVIERAVILARGSVLEFEDMAGLSSSEELQDATMQAEDTAQPVTPAQPEPMTLDEVQRNYILAVLEQTGGVVEGPKGAAKTLGLHPNTLRHRMEKLGIKRSPHRIS